MKRKRRNLQIASSSIQSRSNKRLATSTYFYLPNECWEHAFKFIISDNYNKHCDLTSLSVVSKQFFSITDRLRFTLTICKQAHPFLPSLLHRFTNLTSLNLTCPICYLNKLLHQISRFPSNLTSLFLSLERHTFPTNGLQTFRPKKITTLTSLTCSNIAFLDSCDLAFIGYSFPNLQRLYLNSFCNISEEGIAHLLSRCCNITHLNLKGSLGVKLREMNFEVPKLEELNLSKTFVDDKHSMLS